jgi:hypothetical protein
VSVFVSIDFNEQERGMTEQVSIFRVSPLRSSYVVGWFAAALIFGSACAIVGLPLIYAAIAFSLVVIFASVVGSFPSIVMAASVWALALIPFGYGIETGVLPKLFADEILLLSYLVVLLPMYVLTDRVWQAGFGKYFWILAAFVVCQCLSLLVVTDLIAFRNLLETYILGPMLLVVFLQEASNTDQDEFFANAVVWLTVTIAVLSVVERVVQRNPILEQMELEGSFPYLSPRIVALTAGVYRPYVTFIHPSETGTFMALGLPFALRSWMMRRSWLPAVQVLSIAAGLAVNGTRGVWVGVALSLLLLARNPLRIVLTAIPVAGLGGGLAYAALKDTPFMQRAVDLNDLLGRFVYWGLGARIFADHKILGVGHMQFHNVYLDYVQDVSELAKVSIKQIYVLDNIYLTTLVEHGIIGFAGLIAFFLATGVLLTRLHKKLSQTGLTGEASLVQAALLVLVVYIVSGFFADINQFAKATKFFFILIGFSLGAGARSLRAEKPASPNAADISEPMYARGWGARR